MFPLSPTSPTPQPRPLDSLPAEGTSGVRFNRIDRVLEYIHGHLDEALSVETLAATSCWSRWQLQRVFLEETGFTVANYVRELKLSQAADALLRSSERILDLALRMGFSSEVSFCRAFKQQFGCSPGVYRRRGLRLGIKTPLTTLIPINRPEAGRRVQVRVESRPAMALSGLSGPICGLFAERPDFTEKVPQLWRQLAEQMPRCPWSSVARIGVVDVSGPAAERGELQYWAGVSGDVAGLEQFRVPPQTYAVLTHKGPIGSLSESLLWFIRHWLPHSAYRGLDGHELEIYPPGYCSVNPEGEMSYWLPVAPR